jgi:hypothetical protein
MFSGQSLIERALRQFESVKAQLQKGADACLTTVSHNETDIARLSHENRELRAAAERASKAIRGIERLLSGE